MWFPILWLGLCVVLVLIETATPQLVSIWFALGAAVAACVSMTGVPLPVQICVFVFVSCLALLASRPLAVRMLRGRRVKTNADATVGMQGVVTEAVDNLHGTGRALVQGLSWSARSEDGEPIPEGAAVRVLRIDGVKLIVQPVPSTTNEEAIL